MLLAVIVVDLLLVLLIIDWGYVDVLLLWLSR